MANNSRPSSKELKKWYKKLKQSGFDDIEQDEIYLKRNTKDFGRNHNIVDAKTNVKPRKIDKYSSGTKHIDLGNSDELYANFTSKQDYYYYTTHFLNEYVFTSNRDRVIWEYYSNGLTYKQIVKALKKVKIVISRQTVCNTVKRLAGIMKEKYLNE